MKKFFQILSLLAFVIVACQSVESVATSTPTPITTKTPPVQIQATIPTATENQELINFIELPGWVKSPENNIILLSYREEPDELRSKFMLVNPDDGDNIIIGLSQSYYHHYWENSNHIVFLHDGECDKTPKQITELDILQSTLRTYEIEDYLKPIKNCSYNYESDKTARINVDSTEPTIEVIDSITGEYFPLTSQNDGVSDISYKISPNRKYISVLQHKGIYKFSELWLPIYGSEISIYDLQNRNLILKFDEGQEISSRVLFMDSNKLVYTRDNTPCLIMILSLTKKCIHTISQKFPNKTIVLGDPLSDPRKLSFLYFSGEQGGFCFYDIYSGEMNCPTENFPSLNGQIILNYSLSPDENYFLFDYSNKGCPPPWCDYSGEPYFAVIDIRESQLHEIPNYNLIGYPTGLDSVWRP